MKSYNLTSVWNGNDSDIFAQDCLVVNPDDISCVFFL